MRLLFASDSFKGSLSSNQTAELLTRAAGEVFGPCDISNVSVADGGEGTVNAVIAAEQGEKIIVTVHGPLMKKLSASYGVFGGNKAIIEMAEASGLPKLPLDQRDPMNTTSYGTGELIRDALDRGYRDIFIAIGGSATNDGGMGCARALGVQFLDIHGNELDGFGRDLEKVSIIDTSHIDPRIKETRITVMCDVKNPLCGTDGATYTFGRQKGATDEQLVQLEKGMCNYRDIIHKTFGVDCDKIEGAGAAGGLGAALKVFFHGRMKSGIETVLELIHFDERLDEVDLVVTGEGRTDWQSCFGKVMYGIGLHAKEKGISVLGLSGSLGKNAMDICRYGISSLMVTVNAPMTLDEAIDRAEELYYEAAVRMFRIVKVGMDLHGHFNGQDACDRMSGSGCR